MKKIVSFFIIICLALSISVQTKAITIDTDESYIYSNSMEAMTAPASHSMTGEITEKSLGVSFEGIVDVSSYNNELYVLEKTKGLIYVINSDLQLVRIIGEKLSLSQPESFFISSIGNIYIADTGNKRVVKCDSFGNLVSQINPPDKDKTLSEVDFCPSKIVVDKGERIYIIVKNETNGIYQMDVEGNFLGFFGSVPVVPSLKELFWRSVSTKEQLSRMLLFVPTEYSSMAIDEKGFIYTTVSTNTAEEMINYIKSGGSDSTLAPIRKLNPKNIDILVRNSTMPPAGDLIESEEKNNASRFIDITVNNDGIYSALDSVRGRVFTYDETGNLLYVFGNLNEKKDGFTTPTAICYWGNNTVVADVGNRSIKIFTPMGYANLIVKALKSENDGNYEESNKCWEELLAKHSGNKLAYIGIGKSEMRDGDYRSAMKWFKRADSSKDYSVAFKEYRKIVGKKTIGILAVCILVLVVLIAFLRKILRTKKQGSIILNKNKLLTGYKYGFFIMRHPFEGFWDMQHENKGNIASATLILCTVVLFNLISTFSTGYIVAGKQASDFNILLQGIMSVVIPFGLWCVANWSVTSLMNGSGSFKNIYMYSCYSLTPFVISIPFLIIISNVISLDELGLYNIIKILFIVWIALLFFCGTLTIHQYSAGRTIFTILMIIVAIGIIIFLFLLCVSIVQQVLDFVSLLIEEISLRR